MSALPAEAGDDAYDDATTAAPPAVPVRGAPARRPVPRPGPARVRRPGLHVVPAMRRSSAPLAPFVAVVTALLVLGLAALLGLNTVLAQDAFRIHDLEQSNARLAEREQALRRDLNTLESPATLAERAEALGMLPSSSPLFLRLPDGAVLGAAPGGEQGSADPDALAAVQAAEDGTGSGAASGASEESASEESAADEESASEESAADEESASEVSGADEESASAQTSGSDSSGDSDSEEEAP